MRLDPSLFGLALGLAACSPAVVPVDAASAPVDSAPVDSAASADAVVPTDAGAAPDTDVTLTYRSVTGTFDRAFLGYHRTAGTIDGLYFEISRGADDACPSATSPVPSQLFTVDGIPGTGLGARTEADGVTAAFFDFEGMFREEVAPASATAATVDVTALDLTAGTARATVTFTYGTDGTANGTVSATHCDSLDTDD